MIRQGNEPEGKQQRRGARERVREKGREEASEGRRDRGRK